MNTAEQQIHNYCAQINRSVGHLGKVYLFLITTTISGSIKSPTVARSFNRRHWGEPPGGPASRSRGRNGDTCHPCTTPSPCCSSLPGSRMPPVATSGPDLPLPCSALPGPVLRVSSPSLRLSAGALCPALLCFALRWQLAVCRQGEELEGQETARVGLHNSTGMGLETRIADGDESSCTSPTSALSLSAVSLLTCLSPTRPVAVVARFSSHALSYNSPSAGCRSFLICARVSHPDRPAPTPSLLPDVVRQAEHLISGPLWPSISLSLGPPSSNKATSSLPPCTVCICICIASPRIAWLLRPTSTRPSLLPDSGPSPCIQLPDPAASRASRPYQPPRPNPHLAPLYNEPTLAVLCSVWSQLLLHLSARLRRRSRPRPPSRPVIFLSPSARLVADQTRPSCTV